MDKIKSKDGTLITYRRTGSGPPLVLVHGTTADHTRWPSVIGAFETHFTVYAIDRRGRGESGDTEAYSIEREVEDIAAVINSIGEPVNILGHSFGALCCLEAALLTQNISKMVLYEPFFSTGTEVYPPGIADRIQELADAGDGDGAVAAMFREIAEMSENEIDMLRSLPSWKRRVAMAHTIARETRAEEQYRLIPERFEELHIPVLLLIGGESPLHMKKPSKLIHEALPNSRILVMQDQQHIAMNTAPELFTGEILKFLAD